MDGKERTYIRHLLNLPSFRSTILGCETKSRGEKRRMHDGNKTMTSTDPGDTGAANADGLSRRPKYLSKTLVSTRSACGRVLLSGLDV